MSPLKPILDYLDRARSHVYGVFFFWCAIAFSPILFTTFFVDQNLIYEKTKMLKGEYIRATYFPTNKWWAGLAYLLASFVFAFFMTWLLIWVFPKLIVKRAYGRELDDQYEREIMRLTKESELDKKREQLAVKQLKTVEKVEEVAKKQEALESREEISWSKEYSDFKKTNFYEKFNLIPESVYAQYGNIVFRDEYGNETTEIPTNLISYADSNGLITVDIKQRRISLTEKGKFFVKNWQLENE